VDLGGKVVKTLGYADTDVAALGAVDDGLDDLRAGGLLWQVSGRALLQGVVDDRGVIVGRHQQHPGRQFVAQHRRSYLRAVHARHLMIEQCHLWLMLLDRFQRGRTVLRFGHHIYQATAGQRPDQTVAKQGVVIGDDRPHLVVVKGLSHLGNIAQLPDASR
jgi:hypothetical protein